MSSIKSKDKNNIQEQEKEINKSAYYMKDYFILHQIKDFSALTCSIYSYIRNKSSLYRLNTARKQKTKEDRYQKYNMDLKYYPVFLNQEELTSFFQIQKRRLNAELEKLETTGFIKREKNWKSYKYYIIKDVEHLTKEEIDRIENST